MGRFEIASKVFPCVGGQSDWYQYTFVLVVVPKNNIPSRTAPL
jgi:hypothetical protein